MADFTSYRKYIAVNPDHSSGLAPEKGKGTFPGIVANAG
jgi:hypothetical protein